MIVFFSLFLTLLVHAAETGSVIAPTPVAGARNWALSSSFIGSSSLHYWDDPDHSASTEARFIPSYKISDLFKLRALISVSKELTGEQNATLADTSISLGLAGMPKNSQLKIAPSIGWLVPTHADSRNRASLRGALSFTPRIMLDPKGALSFFSAFYSLGMTRYFHDYETSTNGKSNSEYRINQWTGFSTAIGEVVSLNFDFNYITSWTYQFHQTNQFGASQEISFQITQPLSFAIGHSNEGSALRVNGSDSNISTYDSQTSQIYGAMTYEL